jgi:hypothetical protein
MHKKTTILSYNKAENSKRIKRNEEKVCVCTRVWMLDGVWLVHLTIRNRLDHFMNRKTESK